MSFSVKTVKIFKHFSLLCALSAIAVLFAFTAAERGNTAPAASAFILPNAHISEVPLAPEIPADRRTQDAVTGNSIPGHPLTFMPVRRTPRPTGCRSWNWLNAALTTGEELLPPAIHPCLGKPEYYREFHTFLKHSLPPRAGPLTV